MIEPRPVIDLHSHSTASDGQHAPAEVASRAAAAGVDTWSLTDHDTVAGQEAAADGARRAGIRFVPGIELSVQLDGREIHVLGHFVDPSHPELRAYEDLLAEHRRGRAGRIVARLRSHGIPLTLDDVMAHSGGKTLGRPHVARALVEKGYATTVKQAFDEWLADGRPAFEGKYRLTPERAVSIVRGAGGVPTLAHPAASRVAPEELPRFRALGFEGVEVGHPHHRPGEVEALLQATRSLDLVPTAGSDFHGELVDPSRVIGDARMEATDLARLERRRR